MASECSGEGAESCDGSSDGTILTNSNRLIHHLLLCVDRNSRKRNASHLADVNTVEMRSNQTN